MKHIIKYARKAVILMIGLPILILGLVLIPLPGPGVLVCFAGLFILSLEFEMPRRYMEKAKKEIGNIVQKGKQRQDRVMKQSQKSERSNPASGTKTDK